MIQSPRPGNLLQMNESENERAPEWGIYASCDKLFLSVSVLAGLTLLTIVTLPSNGRFSPANSATHISDADTVYISSMRMNMMATEFHDQVVADGYHVGLQTFTLTFKILASLNLDPNVLAVILYRIV